MANAVPLSIANAPSLGESVNENHYSLDSVLSSCWHVTPRDTSVLLTGETGTGKTRLARIIHELSPRRAAPFLIVDCGVLSLKLIEPESPGQVNGAFHGAICDLVGQLTAVGRGTLLLDEVNLLPLPLQGKLLRALDHRYLEQLGSEVRACVIAASSEPLEQEVLAGRFRADLYSRLNGVAFHLLPLRQQRSAIAPLGHRFLREAAARSGADVSGLSIGAVQALERYDWPGNIRELRNVVDRAVAVCEEREVSKHNLPDVVRLAQAPRTEVHEAGPAKLQEPGRKRAKVLPIEEVLRRRGNNRLRAKWVAD
jgi:DNA-binding NtrC family response regulator